MRKVDENGNVIIKLKNQPEYLPRSGKVQFYFDNNKYFFKKRGEFVADIEPELLAAKIGQKLGINVLQVKPAIYIKDSSKIYGIISKNFVKETDIRVSFDLIEKNYSQGKIKPFNYETVTKQIKNYIKVEMVKNSKEIVVDKNFFKDLQSLIFFDFLIFQEDRAKRNIEFILHKQKINNVWKLSLAPIYDNSMIFGFADYRLMGLNRGRIYIEDLKYCLESFVKDLRFLFTFTDKTTYQGQILELKNQIEKNKHLQKLAVKAYNINIEQCLNEIEQENPNFYFTNNFKALAKLGWQKTKQTLKNEFNIEKFLQKSNAQKTNMQNDKDFNLSL